MSLPRPREHSWSLHSVEQFHLFFFLSNALIEATSVFFVIYKVLFEVLPMLLLCVAHLDILLIARKISFEMKALLNQVKFNVAKLYENSWSYKRGLKSFHGEVSDDSSSHFIAHYRTQIHIWICDTFNRCIVSEHGVTATSLLFMANSTLKPLVYAFLEKEIKRG